MALTDTSVRTAKPRDKEWKLADEKGLYLLITPGGSKLWRMKFRVAGREKKLSFGAYPEVSLKDARAKRDDARARLNDGTDPAHERKAARIAKKIGAGNSFGASPRSTSPRSSRRAARKIRWPARDGSWPN